MIDDRDEGDARKIRLEKNIERLREVQQEERNTRIFFSKLKQTYRKEEIYTLIEEEVDKDTGEETYAFMKSIIIRAASFYFFI